jgi:hypothetical protein
VYAQDGGGRVAVLQGGAGWADRLDRLAATETGGGESQTTTTGKPGDEPT